MAKGEPETPEAGAQLVSTEELMPELRSAQQQVKGLPESEPADKSKPPEKRRMQQIFLLPSLKAEIDERRGEYSRSRWIEQAIWEKLLRDKRP